MLIVLLTSLFYSVGVAHYGYLFNCLLTVCFVVSICKLVVCEDCFADCILLVDLA